MAIYKILVMADGASIHTEKWIYGLSLNPEFEIYLLTMNPSGARPSIGINNKVKTVFEVHNNNTVKDANNYWYVKNVLKIREIVKKVKPDIINTIYLTSYGLMGSLMKDNVLLSHFMIGTDIMVTPQKNFLYKLLTKFALFRGDYFVSSSKTMTKSLLRLHNIPSERLLTQQYGVGEEVINYPRLGKVYDFISNRAWVPNSNIPLILEIFKCLEIPLNHAIIGQGGVQEKKIHGLLSQLPQVKHLGTLQYMDNIHAVAQSKYYISLTSSDGASLSLMEAMALGVVPVVSDVAPNLEWVEDGYNGFVVDINDISKTVSKFEYIAQLPDNLRLVMAARCIDIIKKRGRLVENMKKFSDNILKLLKERDER